MKIGNRVYPVIRLICLTAVACSAAVLAIAGDIEVAVGLVSASIAAAIGTGDAAQ